MRLRILNLIIIFHSNIIIMVKVDDLVQEQDERNKKRNKIYKKIYKLVEKKIIDINKYNLSEMIYEIPYFMINIPLYSMDGCREYLVKKLNDDGFKVQCLENNKIFIDWSN